LIFLNNVSKYFNGSPLFRGVNISIHRGDRIGMVGPNGAGKSTILGLMEGVLKPDEGELSIERRIRMGVLHQELIVGNDGPILQEVMNVSADLSRVRERLEELQQQMAEVPESSEDMEALVEEHGRLQHDFERFDGYALEARALKVLRGLGFQQGDSERSWSEFSGGWRMRVALAKILLSEPDVLLLDEPTNHLDLESLLWVERYLTDFKGAIVLVSHDRAFLNRLVTRIIEVDRGKAITFSGNYDTYEGTRHTQEQIQLAAFKNQEEKRKRIQKFIDQNRVKARTASRAQSRVKMLEKLESVEPPKSSRTLHFNFAQPPSSGRRTLEIKDLIKKYGDIVVYDGFNLGLDRGSKVGLVGPNGAGKSTLMKVAAGILTYEGGLVKYGHNVEMGYFAQHQSESLIGERTVLDEAASTAKGVTEQVVRNLLGAFLFSGDDVFKKVKVLSGGEKSRLALAKILLAPPNFLLMDEPTNHLDIPSCEILEQAMEQYQGTLMLITHDRRLMNRVCTAILEVRDGNAELFLGNYDDYLHKRKLIEEEEEVHQESKPKDEPNGQDSTETHKESRKERKRREAQARIALSRKVGPVKAEVKKIEADLEEKESRRREIQTIMADPSNYENKEVMLPLLEEEPALGKEIKILEARWEELQQTLEEAEKILMAQ
jgi:ATP-binding cassette, subfamily F, member 3